MNRAEFLSAGRNFFSLASHFDFARIAPFSRMGIASCFLLLVRMLRILGGCVKPECGRVSSPILDPLSRQMPLSYDISSTPLPLNLPGLISLLP